MVRTFLGVAMLVSCSALSPGGRVDGWRGSARSAVEHTRLIEPGQRDIHDVDVAVEDYDEDPRLQTLLECLEAAKEQFLTQHEPVVVHECVPDDMVGKLVEAERGLAIEFRKARGGWEALLVKMDGGKPHGAGNVEVAGQLRDYFRTLFRGDGVRPELNVRPGLEDVGPDGRRMNPDVACVVTTDGLTRFVFELDRTSNFPKGQVERAVALFAGIGETMRTVVTVKINDRQKNGRFSGYCVVYRKDDDDRIHVVRAFEVGTTPYAILKRQVRAAWDDSKMILDPAVDDGTADGFALETYAFLPTDRLPRECPDAEIRRYFQVTIPQADFYFGEASYSPPPEPRPFVLDLYEVLYWIDDSLPSL